MNDLKCEEIDELSDMLEEFADRDLFEDTPPMTPKQVHEFNTKKPPTDEEVDIAVDMLDKMEKLRKSGQESKVVDILSNFRDNHPIPADRLSTLLTVASLIRIDRFIKR